MSTKANHRKRSRGSQYNSACYTGGRVSVGTPTVSRASFFQINASMVRMIRQLAEQERGS